MQGKLRHAMIKLKAGAQKDPKNASYRLLLGIVYLKQGNPSGAEIEIRKAIKAGARRTDWLILLAESLSAQSKADELLKEITAQTEDENLKKEKVAK